MLLEKFNIQKLDGLTSSEAEDFFSRITRRYEDQYKNISLYINLKSESIEIWGELDESSPWND